jgi:hypothetical protein
MELLLENLRCGNKIEFYYVIIKSMVSSSLAIEKKCIVIQLLQQLAIVSSEIHGLLKIDIYKALDVFIYYMTEIHQNIINVIESSSFDKTGAMYYLTEGKKMLEYINIWKEQSIDIDDTEVLLNEYYSLVYKFCKLL